MSAPDVAGKGIANPGGAIWAGAQMLEHLGRREPARALMRGLEHACQSGNLILDLGSASTTRQFAEAISEGLDITA